MLEFLLSLSDYMAWCCGFANWKKDGTLVKTTRNFHLDHIDPKSKDGSNQITNRAPLCPDHNIRKKNRPRPPSGIPTGDQRRQRVDGRQPVRTGQPP